MNRGIQVSGGSFSAAQVAVGDRPVIHNQSAPDVTARLDTCLSQMRSLIEQGEGSSDRRTAMLQTVEDIRAESGKANPDKLRMGSMLEHLAKGAPLLTGLAALLTAAGGLIAAL